MTYNFLLGNCVVRSVLNSQEESVKEVIWFLKVIALESWKGPQKVSQYICLPMQDKLHLCYSCQTCSWRHLVLDSYTPQTAHFPSPWCACKMPGKLSFWLTVCSLLVKYFELVFWKSLCRFSEKTTCQDHSAETYGDLLVFLIGFSRFMTNYNDTVQYLHRAPCCSIYCTALLLLGIICPLALLQRPEI